MTPQKPPLHVVHDTTATLEEAETPGRTWFIVLTTLIIAAALGFALWRRWYADPIARLPDAQRHALYVQTLDHFGQVCEADQLGDEVKTLCANEADLLRRFPDCDEVCLERTTPFAHEHPTR
jgi:hypothetical protein